MAFCCHSFVAMEDYQKYFVEQAEIGYSEFIRKYIHTRKYDTPLIKRAIELNQNFEFTTKNIARLAEINDLLSEKEKSAFALATKYEEYILANIAEPNPFVFDYEIDFELALYSSNKYKGHPVLEENPILCYKPFNFSFTKKEHIHLHKQPDGIEEITNWNEYQFSEDHPLKDQNHCLLFHDLYDNAFLAWQDIVDIETIWFDVILKIQNCQEGV